MNRWAVSIEGDAFDLEDLPSYLTSNELRVVKEAATYYVESTRLEALKVHVEVHEEARRLVSLINGLLRTISSSHENISVGSEVRETDASGVRRHTVVTLASIRSRGKVSPVVIKGGAPTTSPPSRESRWAALAMKDADVSDALTLWGHSHDWTVLYKVYEIIRGRDDIVKEGWATNSEKSRFTHTANHPQGAGEGARHSRSATTPPTNPMTLQEAESWLRRILEQWLDSVA